MASWSSTGSYSTVPVDQSTAVLLQTGDVLLMGGNANPGNITTDCSLYDHVAGNWSATGSMATSRSNAMAVVLGNGKVLVFGGSSGDTINSVRSTAELYDPGTGLWTNTGSMATARTAAGFWLLSNGNVLVAGGTSGGGAAPFTFSGPSLSSSEIYDVIGGTWSSTGALNVARQFFSYATGGTTPVAVGGCGTTTTALTSTETYSSGVWTTKTTCSVAGTFNDGFNNAVRLPDGTVLLVGGRTIYYGVGSILASCAVYDVGADTWTTAGSLALARIEGQLFPLNDNTILMAGGNADAPGFTECEIYNPVSKTWSVTAPLADGRSAIYINIGPVLANGKAVLTGGIAASTSQQTQTTELFTPGASPPMSITLIQHVLVSGGSHTITVSPTTAGSLMVVCALGMTGVSDNVNGAYTLVPGTDAADANIFYFANSAAGAVTITMTGTGYNGSASEWSGVAHTSPVDVHGAVTNVAGATPAGPALTTTNAGDLLITFLVDDPAHPITAVSSGFTLIDYDATATSAVAYQVPGALGTYQAIFTVTSGTVGANLSAVAFFPAPSGPSAKKKSSMFLVF